MKERGRLALAVLISGRGSNMLSIAAACAEGRIEAHIVRVIADRATAAGIESARQLGLSTSIVSARDFPDREQFEAALARAIEASGAQLVILAGFMRILSAAFVERFAGRLLNVHPSLLPKYKGLHTHRRALEAGDSQHGASVHFVTADLDGGPVICQAPLAVSETDTEASLAAKVLVREHQLLPYAIGLVASGRLRLEHDRIVIDNQVLTAPLIDPDRR